MLASQLKVNWWENIVELTQPMDLAIPRLAQLHQAQQHSLFTKELQHFCAFLEQHPLAKKHNKSKKALLDHMKLNIDLYLKGLPFHH